MKPERSVNLGPGDALVIVDVQNDFLPGGALPAPRGHEILEPLNQAIAAFRARGLPIFATRDWHPPDHISVLGRGGPWPAHGVAGTPGARFPDGLKLPERGGIVSKATDRDQEAYSGFEGTTLEERLRCLGVRRVFVGGLTTEYCVLNTVKDALASGFDVVLLSDAIRAVDVKPGDGASAEAEMERRGAVPTRVTNLGKKSAA